MYLVSEEVQNSSRVKLVEERWVNNDGTAELCGVYNKMNNVYTPRRKKTTALQFSADLVRRSLEENKLEPPSPQLLKLLPMRANPRVA